MQALIQYAVSYDEDKEAMYILALDCFTPYDEKTGTKASEPAVTIIHQSYPGFNNDDMLQRWFEELKQV